MKHLFSAILVLFLSSICWGANVQVMAMNYEFYGTGAVCVVNGEHNADFESVFHADNFSTDHNNIMSMYRLAGFLDGTPGNADCYDLPRSVGSVNVPNRDNVYVVVLLTHKDSEGKADRAYWKITNLDGNFGQTVTVTGAE